MSRGSRGRDSEYVRDDRRPRISETNSLDSRVYIGGINVKNFSYREIDTWMSKYGNVLDISFCDRHILVQFDRESDATKAIDREQGKTFSGTRFDIRFAHSSDGPMTRTEVPRSRSPRIVPYEHDFIDVSPIRRESVRERSSGEQERFYKDRRPNSPDQHSYDRPRNNIEEKARSNIRPEIVNDSQDSSWTVPQLSNKAPPDRPHFDAAIVVMSSDLLNYAETIESKFQRQMSLTVHIIVLKEESHVNACIDDLEKKGVLYAILVNHLNEKHLSCTLRILHGTGQEHRNMLLTNALSFVARNFDEYEKQHRELKPIVPKANCDPSRMPPGFVAPDDKIIYQLHLLADSRMLTMDELNEVDDFIQKRIEVLSKAEGGVAEKADAQYVSPMSCNKLNKPQQGQLANNLLDKQQHSQINDPYNTSVVTNPKSQHTFDSLMQSQYRTNLSEQQVPDDGSRNFVVAGHTNSSLTRPPLNPMMGVGGMRSMNPFVAMATATAGATGGFYQQPLYRPRLPAFQARPHYPGY